MMRGNFQSSEPGIWKNAEKVQVDLLVPESLGGPGRRGARLDPPHGNKVARKVQGLEAALVDHTKETIGALEETDARQHEIAVAGSAGLLVAKLHKIGDRVASGRTDRLDDKDALDVLRLLRGTQTEPLAEVFAKLMQDQLADAVTRRGHEYLRELFGAEGATGTVMAVRATAGIEDPATIAATCVAVAGDLLAALEPHAGEV